MGTEMGVGSVYNNRSLSGVRNDKRPDLDAHPRISSRSTDTGIRFFVSQKLSLRCEFEFNEKAFVTNEWQALCHRLVSLLFQRNCTELKESDDE